MAIRTVFLVSTTSNYIYSQH